MKNKYFCRNCKGIRNQKELHKVEKRGSENDDYFQWVDKYLIIECEGCDTVSFLKIYGNSDMTFHDEEGNIDYYEDETIYPLYLEKSTEISYKYYLPEKIKEIYSETINSLKSKSFILTAGGLRATIEAICNHLKIKKGNLEERINLLHGKGYLTISESKRLHSIRFLGNDALHEIETPKKEHLFILLDIINHLLTNLYINDKIIKGKVETVIDDFEDFLKLIQNKLTKDMVGKSFELLEIIGNSKRLIPKTAYLKLENELVKETEEGNIAFLEYDTTSKNFLIKEIPPRFNFGIF